jgi:hypothetical protein
VSSARSQEETERYLREGSGPLADLALTLPVFVIYHLGVVWMDVQNAADVVTRELKSLASSSLPLYSALTLTIGAVFAGILLVLGRGHTLRWQRFALVAAEGVLYAVAMRLVASYVVGKVHLAGFSFVELGQLAPSPPAPVPVGDAPGFFTAFTAGGLALLAFFGAPFFTLFFTVALFAGISTAPLWGAPFFGMDFTAFLEAAFFGAASFFVFFFFFFLAMAHLTPSSSLTDP